jgi:hypothetical protein
MPLSDRDYNGFASALVARFRERVKGLDEGSARFVNARPADHILGGFLTPIDNYSPNILSTPRTHQADGVDEELAEDLPRDSAYEQTAIGMEWLAPVKSLVEKTYLEVEVNFFVYVRRLPTFDEQKKNAVWHHAPRVAEAPNQQVAGGTAMDSGRETNLVAAWSREQIAGLHVRVQASELMQNRKLSLDLTPQIRAEAQRIALNQVYPGRRPHVLEESNFQTPELYQEFLTTLHRDGFPTDWRAVLDVRLAIVPTLPGVLRIALRVINCTESPGARSLDYVDPNIYGVGLRVKLPSTAHQPTVFQELPASFRYDREMCAIGINAQVRSQHVGELTTLEIDSVPVAIVPRLEPRDFADAEPDFLQLISDPLPVLRNIQREMRKYDEEVWEKRVQGLIGLEREEAIKARTRFRSEIDRFGRGVDLLGNQAYPFVLRAFILMNEAMKQATAPHQRWRMFQIIFIVSQLSGLAAREYPELSREDDDYVDILWFAAGGGKTEAFLGLIIWQGFFDRLRGKRVGMAALVRFPLRLLTFQQLQRLGKALGAAEVIRSREQLGGARFSIGYFVGAGVTPNKISNELHARYASQGIDEHLQRVFDCPFCSSPVRLAYEANLRLVSHFCTNAKCSGGSGRLPIFVVDDDVYRYLPTIVVATVDKLAQLGQNQRFANLLGRFDLVCHQHGASFKGVNRSICSAAGDFALGTRADKCGDATVSYGPFRDPGPSLLVQDELHLLSEELGTFDAHYETAAMELSRSLGHQPWKIIAATATIEDYEQQAWQLYLRKSRQFPGPGPEAYESFYYSQNSSRIGRIFVGVLGVGRKHTPAVTRTLSLFYLELQAARELAENDPARAAETYGTGPLSIGEFRRLIFLYELPLTYVLTRKGSDQVAEAIESRVKREIQEVSPAHGELVIDTFNGGVDIAEMIGAMERIRTASPESDPAGRVRGLVTTNIIGHGVDVDRFNAIVFAGFTRLVAEYIQASARVGRTYPGISIFVATPQSERDRSVFDRFEKFHEYLDRLVDPTAVNRWPEAALSRTIPGILCGYLMGVAAHQLGRPLSTVESVLDNYGMAGAECLTEEALIDWMSRAYGVEFAPASVYRERLVIRSKNAFSSIVNSRRHEGGMPRSLGSHLHAMRSLRDVDDPAFIVAQGALDVAILKRFTNG